MTEGGKQEVAVMYAANWHHCLNSTAKRDYHLYPLSKLKSIASNCGNALDKWLVALPMLLCATVACAAEGMRPAYTPPPPVVDSGNIIQIILSLLLVMAAIILLVWVLKRMNMAQQGTGNLLKVLGGVSIGQRERIVLVEVEDTWLVIGIAPGQLRTLHAFKKTETAITELQSQESLQSQHKFSSMLSSLLQSRKRGNESQ